MNGDHNSRDVSLEEKPSHQGERGGNPTILEDEATTAKSDPTIMATYSEMDLALTGNLGHSDIDLHDRDAWQPDVNLTSKFAREHAAPGP